MKREMRKVMRMQKLHTKPQKEIFGELFLSLLLPLGGLFALLGLTFACNTKTEKSVYAFDRQVLINGSLYYNEAGCARCHGIAFDGQGPMAADLKKERGLVTPDLKVKLLALKTPMDYFKNITRGTKDYPEHAYQSYSDRGRWAMAYYLYSLSKPPQDSKEKAIRRQALPAMREKLKKIYAKSRRWEMGYKPLAERPQSPKLEELRARK